MVTAVVNVARPRHRCSRMEPDEMALVPYLTQDDLPAEDRELLARPINLFRALANSPGALRHFNVLGEWIRYGCELDPRLRELAILQVGYLTRSPYEWSHHVRIGRDFGVTDEDVAAVIAASHGREHGLEELDGAVLSAARELTLDQQISPATWALLSAHLDAGRRVDLVLVASFYNAVVRVLGGLQIDVEPDYQVHLDEFPLPPRQSS